MASATIRANVRISPQAKATIQKAAKLKNLTLTAFIVSASKAAAEMALADQTRFALSPLRWEKFNAALDAPPRDIPALRRLFNEPSVFEEQPSESVLAEV